METYESGHPWSSRVEKKYCLGFCGGEKCTNDVKVSPIMPMCFHLYSHCCLSFYMLMPSLNHTDFFPPSLPYYSRAGNCEIFPGLFISITATVI